MLSIETVRKYLHMEHEEDDELIEFFIAAATQACSNHIGYTLEPTTIKSITTTPGSTLNFKTVSCVEGWNESAQLWENIPVSNSSNNFTGWYYEDCKISVQYTTQYAAIRVQGVVATTFDKSIEQAILFMTGHFHENRTAVSLGEKNEPKEIPLSVQYLLDPHKGAYFS